MFLIIVFSLQFGRAKAALPVCLLLICEVGAGQSFTLAFAAVTFELGLNLGLETGLGLICLIIFVIPPYIVWGHPGEIPHFNKKTEIFPLLGCVVNLS